MRIDFVVDFDQPTVTSQVIDDVTGATMFQASYLVSAGIEGKSWIEETL